MLRYKTKTRPGLVALYDIRPGNGGPFLQPRSPHGASTRHECLWTTTDTSRNKLSSEIDSRPQKLVTRSDRTRVLHARGHHTILAAKPVPEWQTKLDYAAAWWRWQQNFKMCKAPVKSPLPAYQHLVLYMSDAFPVHQCPTSGVKPLKVFLLDSQTASVLNTALARSVRVLHR